MPKPTPDIAAYAERFPALTGMKHLSNSSLTSYWKCPERWMRRYILGEYEPASGAMIAGRAADAAETENYGLKLESKRDLELEHVLDLYSDEFEHEVERGDSGAGIDWHDEKPGKVKDSGAGALSLYHRTVAPQISPLSVQRRFSIRFEGMRWDFTGYLDLEYRPAPRRRKGAPVADLKLKGKRLSPADADADPQVDSYLAARRAEGNPAKRFDFHVMARTKEPTVELISTTRTDAQLDAFLGRIFYAAGEIAWRTEYEAWGYAPPGAWWCAERWCGFWKDCPGGGGLSSAAAKVVRAGG